MKRRLPVLAPVATGMLLLAIPLLASAPALPPAPPPTHVAAWAATLGRGAVITAERDHGVWRYALGGTPFASGHPAVAPERIEVEIGSISKVFTGLLLAQAVVEGKVALSDTLAMKVKGGFESKEVGAITLRELATHTSCLPRLPDNLAERPDPYARYNDAALFFYLANTRMAKTPPCASEYSNLGFGVLGVMLERAYGKPWETLVREKIAAPLGMRDTAQHLSAEQQARFALPWAGVEPEVPWTFQALAGAGALRSTAADLAKLADALLAGAHGPLKALWPLLTGDEIAGPGIGERIGLALLHDKIDGEDSYWHNGGTAGFRTSLRVFPQSRRAFLVLASNGAAPVDEWLATWQHEGRAAAARPAGKRAESREVTLPAATLDEYPGVYTLSPQARLTIVRAADGLRARLTGQLFLPVYASAKDELFYRAVDAQLSFHRTGGRIAGLTLHQNGSDVEAPRSPEPPPHIELLPRERLQEYVGDYAFGKGAVLTVRMVRDGLAAQLTGQTALPVFATAKDRFEYDVVAAALTFERDAAGHVVAVVLHQNGAERRATRR